MIDIVAVYHNKKNQNQTIQLKKDIDRYDEGKYVLYPHSNIEDNIGFGPACNIEAFKGSNEIIGFLNPDVTVKGPFVEMVEKALLAHPDYKIAGKSYNKPKIELKIWGVKSWVCGAVFFVKRDWFEKLGGFDPRFEWSHEETDFIRTTEKKGGAILDLNIPIDHASPIDDNKIDKEYKIRKFAEAQYQYEQKWRNK